MKFIKQATLLLSSLTYVLSQLVGSQGISTHHYDAVASALDTNPVFCGVLGKHMDISRITAVQGLSANQCGTCLKLTGNGKSVYVMALDKGGKGLDLNKNSFMTLFGEDTGIFNCSWEPTDASNCQGIVSGGDYQLPGMAFKPKVQAPIQVVSSPQPNEEEGSNDDEQKSKDNEKEGWCDVTGASKCTDNKTRISICAFGVVFPILCPAGTICNEHDGAAYCIARQS